MSESTKESSPELETSVSVEAESKVVKSTMEDSPDLDSLRTVNDILNESSILNKTSEILATTEPVNKDKQDLEASPTEEVSERKVAKDDEENIFNKTATMSVSTKESSSDLESTLIEDSTESKAAKDDTTKDDTRDLELVVSEGASESILDKPMENILNKALVKATKESTNEDSYDKESTLIEEVNESVVVTATICDSAKYDSHNLEYPLTEGKVIKPYEENILNTDTRIVATTHETADDHTLDIETSLIEEVSESADTKPNERNILDKDTKIVATTSETPDDLSFDLEMLLNEQIIEIAVAEPNEEIIVTNPNEPAMEDSLDEESLDSTTGEAAETNKNTASLAKTNVKRQAPTPEKKQMTDTCKEAKRARRLSPPRKLYAVLKPPKDDETPTSVLPISTPVQSPEELVKRIQSRFPASISVSVKRSGRTEDVSDASKCSANITIKPKVVGMPTSKTTRKTESISAATTAANRNSTIGAPSTPTALPPLISTTTMTNISNKTPDIPLITTPTSTKGLSAPPTQLPKGQGFTITNVKTISQTQFASRHEPSIDSNSTKSLTIRKATTTLSHAKPLARNCVLMLPKKTLPNDNALVTSVKFLPRFTLNTRTSSADPNGKMQTPTSVDISPVNKEHLPLPPDSNNYSSDNLSTPSHAETPKLAARYNIPTFSPSYLTSLSAYMREAKDYFAKTSTALQTQKSDAAGAVVQIQGGEKARKDEGKELKDKANNSIEDPLALDNILDAKEKTQLSAADAADAAAQTQGCEKEIIYAHKQLEDINLEDPLDLDNILDDTMKQKPQLLAADSNMARQEDKKEKNVASKPLEADIIDVIDHHSSYNSNGNNVIDLVDIESDLVAYGIIINGKDKIDGATQTKESTMEILSKISILKEKVKLQAEEIISLKAAMRLINTQIDIENVST